MLAKVRSAVTPPPPPAAASEAEHGAGLGAGAGVGATDAITRQNCASICSNSHKQDCDSNNINENESAALRRGVKVVQNTEKFFTHAQQQQQQQLNAQQDVTWTHKSRKVFDESRQQQNNRHRIGMVIDMTTENSSFFMNAFMPMITNHDRVPQTQNVYCRPEFLYFSDEDVLLSADQSTRPVLCPRDPSQMPIHAGYAEVINAGKTERNEDHACAKILTILQRGYEAEEAKELDKPQNMINNNKRRFFTKQPAATQRASSECRRNNTTLNKLLIQRRYSDEDLLALSDSDEKRKSKSERNESIPQSKVIYFSIFDGHAGCEAAIVTSNTLHEHIQRRLSEVIETVLHLDQQEKLFSSTNKLFASSSNNNSSKYITSDSLVVGAIQASFIDMDEELLKESVSGGCAVLSVMLMNSKMYVANAGDCRAALLLLSSSSDCVDTEPKSSDKTATDKCLSPANSYHIEQITNDFTPDYERKRIQFLAYKNPELIANCFTRYEYSRLLTRCDLKKSVLYRDWFMDGWASKMVCDSDLKPTLISDHGRKVKRRLLNTIGVSRGFGDHHLLTADDKIPIKPFLSPVPEVHVIDLNKYESLNENDVLIMASDGLWDVLSNEDVARIVNSVLNNNENAGLVRYTVAAHELALSARGNYNDKVNRWQLPNGCNASSDDITIFIIPLKYAKYINNKYNIYYSNYYSNSNVFNNNNHPNSDNYDDDDVELLQ